jgi:hypothetical protein
MLRAGKATVRRWLRRGALLGALAALFAVAPRAWAGELPDGGTAALIQVLAPPPPPRVQRRFEPPAPPVEAPDPPLLPWVVAGLLGVTLLLAVVWAVAERRERARVEDELSRMKSYLAIVQKRAARVPTSSEPPPADAARE